MKLLVLDNVDSFTYMLVDYLRQAGADCEVVRNTVPVDRITAGRYDGVVLSPGPGTPDQAGCLLPIIEHYHRIVPMLGVCLGHQALGQFFGARLEKAVRPMHGKLSVVRKLRDDLLLQQIPDRFEVTRYHSWILSDLPPDLIPLAETEPAEPENMMFRHRVLPLWGVQFHPEAALTQYGLALLKNWITFVKSSK
ncbi:anthranilate synthase component II [Larkinella soli]|uniref:anthranilate synthase component II n=1 Tax=Larkinella soli TaxID=1770527 RepID=UPI000FFC0623|nr:aminodeoxychorismate/anthranilate synthase component II [Larkinella soli]